MSKKDEALKLALEALECDLLDMALNPDGHMGFRKDQAITAIREALAEQPAPFVLNGIDCSCGRKWRITNNTLTASEPEQQQSALTLYKLHAHGAIQRLAPKKPWVGLTEEEVDECYYWKDRQWTTDELVRHVEAKLREKNA